MILGDPRLSLRERIFRLRFDGCRANHILYLAQRAFAYDII